MVWGSVRGREGRCAGRARHRNMAISNTLSNPPSDQFELGRVGTAQVSAQMVLGHVLAAKGDFKSALPWFELASQEMNDTMYVVRHPFYSLNFKAPPDLLFGRGFTLAAHGMAVLGVNPSSAQAADLFKKAKEYFDTVGYQVGDLFIQFFKCNALYKTGRFEQLVTEAQTGIVIAEKLGLQDALWQFHAIRGTAFLQLENWNEAEKSLRTAQNIIDLTSGTESSNTTPTLAGLTKNAITEGLVSIGLRKRGAEAEIFEDLERGRARTFVSLLASRSIALGREEALVQKIRALDDEIAKERGRKTAILGGAQHPARGGTGSPSRAVATCIRSPATRPRTCRCIFGLLGHAQGSAKSAGTWRGHGLRVAC